MCGKIRAVLLVMTMAFSGLVMVEAASMASAHVATGVVQVAANAPASSNLGGGLVLVHRVVHKRAQENLCLKAATSECIVSNGAGNQVTIDGSGWINFNISTIGSHTVFTNANGHPLRMENQPYVVELGNGGFNSSDDGAKWDNHTTLSDVTWTTAAHPSEFMGTFNIVAGKPVWGDTGVGDSFYKIGQNL